MLNNPTVAILMATYNGQDFLIEQLESIVHQDYKKWSLWCSDDGSSDSTLKIINDFKNKYPENSINIVKGPGKGFCDNFLSLVKREDIKADLYAFCDQDDIWKPQKLSRALSLVADISMNIPFVYCSRTDLIDKDGNLIGESPLFDKSPSIKNALVQSIAGGNTMLFNNSSRFLLKQIKHNCVSHDWMTYLMVTACNGRVIYDKNSYLLYRQHGGNLIGSNNGMLAKFKRFNYLLQGEFRKWNERNLICLNDISAYQSVEAKKIISEFALSRDNNLLMRVNRNIKMRLYRQTIMGNIGFWIAVILNKV